MKYYTPTIEEFHVGFRFEIKYETEGWLPETFGEGDRCFWSIPQLQYAIKNYDWKDVIRVKYLDYEDIESEGWNVKTKSETCLFAVKKYDDTRKEDDTARLVLTPIHHVCIDTCKGKIYPMQTGNVRFVGTIRNRSELHRLMQQLGIK